MSIKNFLRNGTFSTFISIDHPPAPEKLDYTNWLLFPSLLGGSYPYPADIIKLNNLGFNYIINLIENGELKGFPERIPYTDKKIKTEFPNIKIKYFSIKDVNVPEDNKATYKFCRDIYDLLIAGNKIYLHCIGGRGRTSIIAGVILYFYGFSYEEVIEWLKASYISRRNKGKFPTSPIPETPLQKEFLKTMYSTYFFQPKNI